MKIVASTEEDKKFFHEKTTYLPRDNFRGIKLVGDDGTILAMVGYDNWTHTAVAMHVFLSSAKVLANRTFIRECFSYPFLECDKIMVIGTTPSHITRALRLNEFLGFREVHRIKDGWMEGSDMVIQQMLREDCHWLRKEAA